MTELQRLLYRELYKKSLYEFVKAFWNTADPSKFVDGQLVQFYCETFQYMCRKWVHCDEPKINLPEVNGDIDIIDVRQNKRNININVPPRHSKSMIFNVLGPVWLWLNKAIKAVSISHTEGLASKMNTGRKKVINSDKFKYFFPEIKLEANSNVMLRDDRGGELYSQNRNAMTGYGGDVIINDDLTNAEVARKDKEEMANAWAYYQNTLPSRINNPDECIIMNIQQRLAPNDITGHILNDPKLAERYIFIVLPAIFEKETYIVCPISGKIFHYKKGDPLWPERFGDYEALKVEVGESVFETQYMQKPIASDKTIIKPHMIIEKDANEVPSIEEAEMIYASHDFPVKDKDTSDFLGSILAYKVGSTVYIKDCLEKRMAFVKSVEYVRGLDYAYPGIIQIIEDKANGSPIIQQLQDEVAGIQAYQPGSNSKTDRLDYTTPYINNVVFVRDQFNKLTQTYQLSESLMNLKKRLLAFPFVEHDDIVDAFSMLILFIFMDRRYMVYGRSFNDENIIDINDYNKTKYSTIFFNKEGDNWKVLEIDIRYGETTKLYVRRELKFKASIDEGLSKLKEFAPDKKVFIDCSPTPALEGMYRKTTYVERYAVDEINKTDDFDKSVAQLNLAFAKKLILIDKNCKLTKGDIENFKFSKSKDENVKYITQKDGFVACMRIALKYFGGII